MANSDDRVKLQAWLSLDSYEGWAIAHILDKGWKNHDLCRTIVREWLSSNSAELQKEYGASRAAWEQERGGKVLPIANGRRAKPHGPT